MRKNLMVGLSAVKIGRFLKNMAAKSLIADNEVENSDVTNYADDRKLQL